jgi:hypothetical protein
MVAAESHGHGVGVQLEDQRPRPLGHRQRRDRQTSADRVVGVGIDRAARAQQLVVGQHLIAQQLRHDEDVTDVDDAVSFEVGAQVGVAVDERCAQSLGAEVGAAAEAGSCV